MGENINNIHDKFVRETFADLKRAEAFFEKMLPIEITTQIDLKTIKEVGKSYMDSQLSEYFSDLVFEVSLKGNSKLKTDVVLLFEHKSAPDKNVLIQVGYYMFAHYFKCVKQRKKLKVIIPVIYYQGETKWKVPQLWDLFKEYPDAIKNYIPNLQHVFIALHSIADEMLLSFKNKLLTSALVAQKWRFNPVKLSEDIIKILSIFKDKDYDWNFLEMTFVYMLNVSEIETEEVKNIINAIPPKIKVNVMTTYAMLRNEAKIEGKIEGKTEMILGLYDDGIDIHRIAKFAKMLPVEIEKILRENGRIS
jgi:predicted transposase/invertase (TIGR01784 family)